MEALNEEQISRLSESIKEQISAGTIIPEDKSKKMVLDTQKLDPFNLTFVNKLFISKDELELIINQSGNEEMIKNFNYLKELWLQAMTYDNSFKDMRNEIMNLDKQEETGNIIEIKLISSKDIDRVVEYANEKTRKWVEENE